MLVYIGKSGDLVGCRRCLTDRQQKIELLSFSTVSSLSWVTQWGNEEEMEREWGNGEKFTLYISSFSLYFFPLYLSISYIKICHILLQNVKCVTFVANVTKISTYALWGNNSGSNLLRGSSASCAGLVSIGWCCVSMGRYWLVLGDIGQFRVVLFGT